MITLTEKTDKYTTGKEHYILIFLMKTEEIFLNYQVKFNNILKQLYTMNKWDLSLRCNDNSTYENR